MAGCRYCGEFHSVHCRCDEQRKAEANSVVTRVVTPAPVVTEHVVTEPSPVVTRGRRYADRHTAQNRAAYMRAYRHRHYHGGE
jgi:hypothetical protein